jgi:hypothetical protein
MGANMLDFAKDEAQLVWRRYNNMLVANSILLGFIGQLILRGDITQKIIPAGACILGLVITLCWLFLTSYGWSLSHRWLLSAEDDCKKVAGVYKDWVKKYGENFRRIQCGVLHIWSSLSLVLLMLVFCILFIYGQLSLSVFY